MNDLQGKARTETINLRSRLSEQGYTVSDISKKQYNYEFKLYFNSLKFKIQVYFGKKGIKKVLQGNSDSIEYQKLREIVDGTINLFPTESPIDEPEEYIGTDETGKGDIFGPLEVAAVFVDKKTKEILKYVGVKDSKMLSKNEIISLAKKIEKIVDNKFVILELTPAKYNLLYKQFGNLNKLLSWAHSEVIKQLLNKVKCQIVITDKFSRNDLEVESDVNFSNVQFLKYSKGERFVGVAAASILARFRLENWFKENKINNQTLPKGASEKAEIFLKSILEKADEKKLTNYAKLHFKSFKKFSK
jgi:ribonuclease HIII